MHRLNVLWIPLLAALLAGPPAQRLPAGAPEAAVGRLETSALAVGLPRTAVRLPAVPEARSFLDRHGAPAWALHPGGVPSPTGAARPLRLEARGHRLLLPKSSRHYPLFPTGPPQHG